LPIPLAPGGGVDAVTRDDNLGMTTGRAAWAWLMMRSWRLCRPACP